MFVKSEFWDGDKLPHNKPMKRGALGNEDYKKPTEKLKPETYHGFLKGFESTEG